ncbi:MAG: 50S ribosomal protein L11 methyltransferase [Blastocatellales bacterium]
MHNDLFSKSEVPSMCLRDAERTEAFGRAIRRVVKPGDVVLDAGAGSGILSFFAAAAGARKVYAVEYDSGLADLLCRNIALNGFNEVIEVVRGDIREVKLPVQADVLIAELIETWLLDELQIPAMNALRANRAIGAKTKIIPEYYEAFATLGYVEASCYGFQLPFPLHNWPFVEESSGWKTLPFVPITERVKAFDLHFNRYLNPDFNLKIDAKPIIGGTVNAVKLSGVAHLTSEILLGPTVAFNGDKVIPVAAFEAQPGEPVILSLSGRWGGGLTDLLKTGQT